MNDRVTVFFDFETVAESDVTPDDVAFADRQGWQWPLYRCPLCLNMVGSETTYDGLTVLDQHFFDLNGHWRQCEGSWALMVATFKDIVKSAGSETLSAVPETPSPPGHPERKRPSRAAKARRRRYQRRSKPPRAA